VKKEEEIDKNRAGKPSSITKNVIRHEKGSRPFQTRMPAVNHHTGQISKNKYIKIEHVVFPNTYPKNRKLTFPRSHPNITKTTPNKSPYPPKS
jgi:hypothetical protein